MATQPQKNNVVNLLTESIEQNLETIEENKLTIIESQSIIDDFNPSCKGLDSRIVTITSQINTLLGEISSLNLQAYGVGCGTTIGSTTIYPDNILDSSYNLSNEPYDDEDPYLVTNTTLTTSNVGFGTFVIYRKNDNLVAGIGISYSNVDSCFRIGCVGANCVNFSNQIQQKQSQIEVLRSELNQLVTSVNSLKTDRLDYQTRRWTDKHTNKLLIEDNKRMIFSIETLNKSEYDQYI